MLATHVVLSLVAVTFGWVPSGPEGTAESDADSYEYLVQLSPEDVEALRAGRIDSLASELPAGVGPVARVRLYVSESQAPRRLTARDEASPRRLAESRDPQRHVVAKPAVPVWDDAASIAANSVAASTAEGRTAFQNPSALDPRTLTDGFQRGAQQGGQYLSDQTRDLTRGAQEVLDRAGDGLRDSARDVLNGASNLLQGQVPGAGAYGNRPQYDSSGRPMESTVVPPQPTQAYTPPPAPLYREPGVPANTQPNYAAGSDQYRSGPAIGNAANRGFAEEGFADRSTADNSDTRIAEPFAGGERRQLTEIPRQSVPAPRDDRFDPFARPVQQTQSTFGAGTARQDDWPRSDPFGSRTTDTAADFVPLPATPGGYATVGQQPAAAAPPYNPASVATPPPGQPPAGSRDSEAGFWNGGNDTTRAAAPVGGDPTMMRGSNQEWDMDRFLVVVMTAVTCYTLFTHVELRNKYRQALRGLPTSSGFGLASGRWSAGAGLEE